ncbi:MAG TPA: phosphoribosylglycinamide formyltransferase [Firmicutes bacterium]|nr:phosphoribosylglycinamide formyltransferase [Bacillota bacterium]
MGKLRLAVLASGRGSNLQAIIDAIAAGELAAEIAVVISDKEDARALERARRHRIPHCFLDPKEHPGPGAYDRALVALWREYRVDLVALAGFMRLLGAEAVRAYRNRILNIHPSLLPAFPGLNAQAQAVAYGVRYSGCTVHFVDEGMDTGPIILQAVVPVRQDDDPETLAARILEEEHRLYPRAIQLFAEGRLEVVGRRVRIKDK